LDGVPQVSGQTDGQRGHSHEGCPQGKTSLESSSETIAGTRTITAAAMVRTLALSGRRPNPT